MFGPVYIFLYILPRIYVRFPFFADEDQIVILQHLPLYILVKLEKTRAATLPGLPPNVIPIQPADIRHSATLTLDGLGGTVARY